MTTLDLLKLDQLYWHNGKWFRSTPIEDDISTPIRGVFHFDADQGGERQIFVRILPENRDQESEEKFSIVIEDPSPAEISPDKGNITITVLKKVILLLYKQPFFINCKLCFSRKDVRVRKHPKYIIYFQGHPNGVVQFGSLNSDSTLSTRQVKT